LDGCFGFAIDDEVRMILKEVRQLGGRQAHEPHSQSVLASGICPSRLATVIDQRRKDDGNITFNELVVSRENFMSLTGADGCNISQLNARTSTVGSLKKTIEPSRAGPRNLS
jgi:hypothetical protein